MCDAMYLHCETVRNQLVRACVSHSVKGTALTPSVVPRTLPRAPELPCLPPANSQQTGAWTCVYSTACTAPRAQRVRGARGTFVHGRLRTLAAAAAAAVAAAAANVSDVVALASCNPGDCTDIVCICEVIVQRSSICMVAWRPFDSACSQLPMSYLFMQRRRYLRHPNASIDAS